MSKTKPKGKQHESEPITPSQALELLESAVSYCQQAGLQVSAVNDDHGTLTILIPGAFYMLTDNGTHAAFRLQPAEERVDEAPDTTGSVSALADELSETKP